MSGMRITDSISKVFLYPVPVVAFYGIARRPVLCIFICAYASLFGESVVSEKSVTTICASFSELESGFRCFGLKLWPSWQARGAGTLQTLPET